MCLTIPGRLLALVADDALLLLRQALYLSSFGAEVLQRMGLLPNST